MGHEIYEIILENMGLENLGARDSGGEPDPVVCLQAERFAVAVLMQPDIFAPCAQDCGLDVVALHDRFGSSYASAALRLAEVVRVPPLLVSCTSARNGATRQAGPSRPRCGPRWSGGRPASGRGVPGSWAAGGAASSARDRAIPPGSLAELAAQSGRAEYGEADGIAGVATPVIWKGWLAKVAVVAVPWEHRRALEPQLDRPGWWPDTRNNPRTALAAP